VSAHTFEEIKALQKERSRWLRDLGCHGIFLTESAPGVWGFRLHFTKVTKEIEQKVAEGMPGVSVTYSEVPPPRAQS